MPLPDILEFVGTNVTQAGFKTAQAKLLDYVGLEVPTRNYVDELALKSNKGVKNFATEALLKAYVPTAEETDIFAYAWDVKNTFEWKNGAWESLGPSELDLANQYTDSTAIKKKKIDDTDDILVSITDQNLNRTWLEANSEDGGPTQHTRNILEKDVLKARYDNTEDESLFLAFRDKSGNLTDLVLNEFGQFADFVVERVAKRMNDKHFTEYATKNTDYFLAIKDRSGNLTDITLNEQGQFADFVVERLSKRLNIPETPSADATSPSKAYYFNEQYGKTYPFESTNKILATWGSSSIDRSSDYILAICKQMGIEFIDGGVGGEDIDQTRERMGEGLQEITFKDGTIPRFNNEVEINVKTNMHYLGDYDGWINVDGQIVSGRIDYRTATAKHYFKRLDKDGVETTTVNTTAYPFTPLCIEKHKIATTILWAGKNNLSRAEASNSKNSVAYCVQKTKDMYNFLTPLAKRCLVISHFVDTNSTDGATAKVLNCNAILKEQYGDVYLDIQEWMCSPQMWVDTGITPTDADLIAQTEGKKPSSVSSDSAHFTPTVYNVIVNKLIFPKLKQLGWF